MISSKDDTLWRIDGNYHLPLIINVLFWGTCWLRFTEVRLRDRKRTEFFRDECYILEMVLHLRTESEKWRHGVDLCVSFL